MPDDTPTPSAVNRVDAHAADFLASETRVIADDHRRPCVVIWLDIAGGTYRYALDIEAARRLRDEVGASVDAWDSENE